MSSSTTDFPIQDPISERPGHPLSAPYTFEAQPLVRQPKPKKPQRPLELLYFFTPGGKKDPEEHKENYLSPDFKLAASLEKIETYVYKPDTPDERRLSLSKLPQTCSDYFELAKKHFEKLLLQQPLTKRPYSPLEKNQKIVALQFIINLLFDAASQYKHLSSMLAFTDPTILETPFLKISPPLLQLFKKVRTELLKQKGYKENLITTPENKQIPYWVKNSGEIKSYTMFLEVLTSDLNTGGSLGDYFFMENYKETETVSVLLFEQIIALKVKNKQVAEAIFEQIKKKANQGLNTEVRGLTEKLMRMNMDLYFIPSEEVSNREKSAFQFCKLADVIHTKKQALANTNGYTNDFFAPQPTVLLRSGTPHRIYREATPSSQPSPGGRRG